MRYDPGDNEKKCCDRETMERVYGVEFLPPEMDNGANIEPR